MRTSKVATSLQKTYDECFLKCSTAVYFESQANEREALRNWKTVDDRITEFNAYGLPSGFRPRSETEKALQDSLADMHLQAKERINILETLRRSRAADSANTGGSSYDPQRSSTRAVSSSSGLGDGTVRPVDYSEISRPAPPPRPPPHRNPPSQASMRPSSQLSSNITPSVSPSPYAIPSLPVHSRVASRTPSPSKEKKEGGLRMTLRDGRDKKRDSKSRSSGHKRESGVAAAKAASQAWIRPSTGSSGSGLLGESSNGPYGSQRTSFIEPSSNQATPGDSSPDSNRKFSSDFGNAYSSDNQQSSSRNNSLSSQSAYRPWPPNPPYLADEVSSRQGPERLDVSYGGQSQRPVPPPPPPRLTRGSDSETTASRVARRKPVANSSSPRTKPAENSRSGQASSSSSGESKARTDRSPRKPARRSRKNEDLVSAESQMTPPSSDSEKSPSHKEGGNEEWKSRVAYTMKNLPKGVDEQAAKQIFNEIVIQGDEVHWDDVAGLDIAKNALKEAVVYPFLRPDLFMGLREPARGMLLFGPPGTGKTMLARAVATESRSTFFSISASSLTSKFLGESEKLVRALFQLAKALAPSIIFVDEIDSLLSSRSESGEHEATRRIKTEFLIQWSDLQRAAAGSKQTSKEVEKGDASRVLVLAATNLPWAIDEAARRRFVRRAYIPLPEDKVRSQQLKTLIGHQKHELRESDIAELVRLTDGFSGSDITALAKDAAMGPLRSLGEALLYMKMDQIRPIGISDFRASLTNIRPSVSKEGLKQFEDWAKQFGERGG